MRTKPEAGSSTVRPSHEPTPTMRAPATSATMRAPAAPTGSASITVSPSSAASPARTGPARSASGGSTARASRATRGPSRQPPPARTAASSSASEASTRVTVARGSPVARATAATEAPGSSARRSSTWNARRIDWVRPAPASCGDSSAKATDSSPRPSRVARPMTDPDALQAEAVALLRELLRVDTSNPPGNETAAAELLRDYLVRHGIECELVARVPGRANLVARIRGSGGGPSLALTGHTDVVPADAQDWQRPPFGGELDGDGYVWGRGAVDMKSHTATNAVALATLAREGFRPRGDLVLIAQADEEDGSEAVGMQWLVEARPDLRVDYAVDEGGGDRIALADGERRRVASASPRRPACPCS